MSSITTETARLKSANSDHIPRSADEYDCQRLAWLNRDEKLALRAPVTDSRLYCIKKYLKVCIDEV